MRKIKISVVFALIVLLTIIFAACDLFDGPHDENKDGVTFTITFDTQGGSEVKPIIIKEDESITMPSNPTKEGFLFAGWYLDNKFVEKFTINKKITSNITLYAKWVTDECEHTPVIDAAVEPTCTQKGVTEGSHCSKCEAILIQQEEIAALGHIGGQATCTQKAVCSRCNEQYGSLLAHEYGELIAQVESTCSATGMQAHFECSNCHKVFKNDDNKTETTIEELVIAVNPDAHSFGEWVKDENADTHTRVCAHNGKHTQTENCRGGDATCTEKATCEVCHERYGSLLSHEYGELIEQVESTCSATGMQAHFECSNCHKVFKNDDNKTETTIEELVIAVNPDAHDYIDGICKACGIRKSSKGLSYSLNEDNNSYTVTGIGSCTDKEIIIPSKYNSKAVTSIGRRAFYKCTGLTNITIPDSVIRIGDWAFYWCTGLTSVNWNATACTSAGSYDYSIFEDCTNLATVNIGENVTSIPSYAFQNCTGLTSIIIPDSVTSIGVNAFRDCTGLTSVTIGNSVTSIGGSAFGGCTGLTSITVSNGNTKYYSEGNCLIETASKRLILGCENSIIPDSVTSIGDYAFRGCTGLTSISIPDSVTSIGEDAFSGCSGLTIITIPDSVTSIGDYAFHNTAWCNNQPDGLVYAGQFAYKYKGTMPENTSITIKDGTLGICASAFEYCTGLTSVIIPDSVTSIGYSAFSACTRLTSIYYNGDVAGWCEINGLDNLMGYGSSSKTLYIGDNNIEGELIIPDSVTTIPSYAFRGCTGLTSVIIPDSVTSIGGWTFNGCTGLTSITIPASVTSIGDDAFQNCYKLVEVFNKSSLTITAGSSDNGYVAYYTKNVYTTEGGNKTSTDQNGYVIYTDGTEKILVAYTGTDTELTLPSDVTQIYKFAFRGCTDLTSVIIPDSVTSIDEGAFRGCSGLTSISGPSDMVSKVAKQAKPTSFVVNITSGDSIGSRAFYGCTGLTSVIIPDSVTSIDNLAFSGCTGLTSVNWNATACTSAGSGSYESQIFYGCKNLATVNIGENVTSIPSYAFYGCTGLTSVTIGSSVTSVGDWAFSGCTGLTSIYYTGDVAGWCEISGLDNLMSYGSSSKTLYIGGNEVEGELIIPDSVTNISEGAFSCCTGLTSIIVAAGNKKYYSEGNCLIETESKTLILGCNIALSLRMEV